MQVSDVVFFILISITVIFVSSSEAPKNADQYYDRNSIKQNEKLVRLFLRLAYQTANRVVELKNAARAQATNRLDNELQNLTLKEIMQGQEQPEEPKNDTSAEIQGRFLFPIGSKTFSDVLKSAENINIVTSQLETLALNKTDGNINMDSMVGSGAKNILNSGLNKTMNAAIDQSSTLISDSNALLNVNNMSDVNDHQSMVENLAAEISDQIPAEDVQTNMENIVPGLRFLSNIENETNLNGSNGSEKIKIITESSGNDEIFGNSTKSENVTLKSQLNTLEQDEKNINQSQVFEEVTKEKAFSVPDDNKDERSRRNIKELDAAPCENKTIDDMFKFSFDESDEKYSPNLDRLMSKMKLQDIVDQLSKTRK